MDPVESRISDGLTRLANDLPPSEDAWGAQQRRQTRARARRRRLAPIAVAAGVIAVAAGIAPVLASDPAQQPQPLPYFEPGAGASSDGNPSTAPTPTSRPDEDDSDTQTLDDATRRAEARDAAQRAEHDASFIPCFDEDGYLAQTTYLDVANPNQKPMTEAERDKFCRTTHGLRGTTKYSGEGPN